MHGKRCTNFTVHRVPCTVHPKSKNSTNLNNNKNLVGENLVKSFEDLTVWKEAMQMTVLIYSIFKNCKDYGFKDQIQRASVSIPSNIAEGFERQTNKEFIQFLFIAKGSCGELQTQLYLSIKLEYLSKKEGQEFIDKAKKISSMIYNLINYRKTIK